MATTKSGGLKTGFGGFGKNVVSSNKSNAAKQASSPAFGGGVSSAFKSGATNVAKSVAESRPKKASSGSLSSASGTYKSSGGGGGSSASTQSSLTAFAPTFKTITPTANTLRTPTIGVADTMAGADPLKIPTAPALKDYSSEVYGGNVGLGASFDGTFQIQDATKEQQQTVPQTTEDYLRAVGIPVAPQPESLAEAYLKAEKAYGIKKKQELVNTYQTQLNAIVAKSQADQLSVTGQGRGIPEAIIGGQQAQIAKEAAIQALPVQAQLAAAQGDLDVAQDRLDTYYKVVSEDINNKFNYQMKLYDTVYDYANKQQQIKIDELRDEKNFQRQKELAALNFSYDKQIKQLGIAQEGAVALTAAQKTKQDAITNVLGQLDNYRNLVNQYTGIGGSKLFGEKAAELRTAKSALEFSIASAVGTGALQAADREVVRDLLPDPTSISGSAGILARGGKSGALKAIDQARSIFSGSLGTIGSGGQQTTVTRPEDFRSKYNY